MKQGIFEIKENTEIADGVWKMKLEGDTSAISAPGQFVNIRLDGHFLRRPISVCDLENETLTIIYKTVGAGTLEMSRMKNGSLDILTGLGNGYNLSKSGERPLLIGGGVGVPPLYLLARRLIAQGRQVSVITGFNRASDVFFTEEFRALGADVKVTTADGSAGIRGFVTDALSGISCSYVYTCGPEAMLKAVYRATDCSGQYSFEERMGCGFGACMGCTCKTVTGSKRICKAGPVLEKEEILW